MKIQIQFLLMILISLLVQAQAQEITERSIKEILNSDGTIRKGVEGSFNVQGYQMHYGKNGDPIFLPKPQDITEGTWSSLGTGASNGVSYIVDALAVSGDNVFVGGNFTQAGGHIANFVARYNFVTGTWHSLGSGTSNGLNAGVSVLAVSGDNVFVGGNFTQAGGQLANRVARYNLTTNTWHTLGSDASNGVNAWTRAIAVSGENVFVGGDFSQAGGQSANHVARYNLTTNTWHSLGDGTSNGVSSTVYALVVSGNDVYIGGAFRQAGGQPANRVARYNLTTNTWHSLGTGTSNGVNNNVYTLVSSGDNLFVGGEFTQAGGQSVNYVARFNLTTGTWYALGTGSSIGVNNYVYASASLGENLFVGGYLSKAGGQSANYVARFNLTTGTWHTLGTSATNGVNGQVRTLVVSGDKVFVGGDFSQAGGQMANYVAVYTESLTSVEEDGVFINSYILHQNYPNPFNPSTTISFSIPTSEIVTLKVYDMLGREVATLVNEYKPAGTYNVQFSTVNNQLSSGVYFYKLQAGKFSEVKKMILAK